MTCSLIVDPPSQRRVTAHVPRWHYAMAILSFKFDQLFILLVPADVAVVVVGVAFSFPSKADFVQKFLSVWLNFVIVMVGPLSENPMP
jgi:hypothetical protein